MSEHSVGALIIFQREKELNAYDEMKAVSLNSDITSELIENIFFKNSPLHDGAVIISDFRISKARVLFDEISNNPLLPLDLGSRHKAGVGATEGDNDCISVMVSEETGHISYAIDGELKRYVTTDALYGMLKRNLIVENYDEKQKNKEQISAN
jgi:diadenylate cyclase